MSPELSTLTSLFKEHFCLNLSRTKCLSLLILTIFELRTVSLWKLSEVMQGGALVNSHYRRLQRFMAEISLPQKQLAKCIVSIFNLRAIPQWRLILDRTNWKVGETHINILYLAVCYKNLAIPLFGHF